MFGGCDCCGCGDGCVLIGGVGFCVGFWGRGGKGRFGYVVVDFSCLCGFWKVCFVVLFLKL